MAWLARLTALRTLRLSVQGQALRLPAGFSLLTQLAEADVSGSRVEFVGSRLPSSLTRLRMAAHNPNVDEPMAQQVCQSIPALHLRGMRVQRASAVQPALQPPPEHLLPLSSANPCSSPR